MVSRERRSTTATWWRRTREVLWAIAAASSMPDNAVIEKNAWSKVMFCTTEPWANGPRCIAVPYDARIESARVSDAVPNTPKRSAAQRTNGNTPYTNMSGRTRPRCEVRLSEELTKASATRARSSSFLTGRASRTVPNVRSSGVTIITPRVSPSDHSRHATPGCATMPLKKSDETPKDAAINDAPRPPISVRATTSRILSNERLKPRTRISIQPPITALNVLPHAMPAAAATGMSLAAFTTNAAARIAGHTRTPKSRTEPSAIPDAYHRGETFEVVNGTRSPISPEMEYARNT